MNEHIGKPFDMGKLVSLLLRITGFSVAVAAAEALPQEASATPSSVTVATDGPPEVPGLDLATALDRMAGMHSLYARTARDFCAELETTGADLQGLLQQGDWPNLRMRLHTLKGNAGTLGATSLAAKAAELEALCKSGHDAAALDAGLRLLDPLLHSTRQSLIQAQQLLAPGAFSDASGTQSPSAEVPQVKPSAEALSPTQAALLRELHGLLEASNLEALDRFTEMRPQLQGHASLCAGLDDAFQVLNLAQAQTLCKAALEQTA
jgi:HPt (histidine-containing phosphotransfer) domain-containing protein